MHVSFTPNVVGCLVNLENDVGYEYVQQVVGVVVKKCPGELSWLMKHNLLMDCKSGYIGVGWNEGDTNGIYDEPLGKKVKHASGH